MGDTFIRSAYLVYDLDNNEISIAQTNFNATTNNVLEIGTGTEAVPSATAVANAVSASTGANNALVTGSVTLNGGTAAKNAAHTTAPSGVVAALLAVGVVFAVL